MLFLLLGCMDPEPAPLPTTQVHATLLEAERLAEQARETWPATTLGPGWIQTVYAFGWHRLFTRSGDRAHQQYYRDWMEVESVDYEGEEARGFNSSDSMALTTLAVTLMLEDPSLSYPGILAASDQYLFEEALRLESGAISHWADDTAFVNNDEVWIDSLFMFGMTLLRQWERTGDRRYHDLFVEQYVLFSELCRSPDTQLYHHAWSDSKQQNIPSTPVFWARGNSWVLIAAAEYLALAGADADPRIAPLFEAHVEATLATQDLGLWHTVMNQPEGPDPANYLEVSGSALIAYALVRGYTSGALDDAVLPAIDEAVTGVRAELEERDGRLVVHGTSVGTNPGDYDYYTAVPVFDDLMLGIGSVILFFAEVDGLERP